MRKLNVILIIAILVCFVGTAVMLLLLPDQVPVHMNFSGEVDRLGSKFEYLIFPAIAAGAGVFFLLMSKTEEKKGPESNANILMWCGIAVVAVFTVLGFIFMMKARNYDPDAAKLTYDDGSKFTGIAIGALLVVLGNIMPKARMNSMFGIRTSWSLASDSVWQKTQRVGGFSSVICGFVMVILSLFIPGSWSGPMILILVLIMAGVGVWASRHYYLEEMR
ncbi:MAG: SdpI family protein [Clostridiales bacterium]|nr:SdpI family protein [Clostridiales bacterium]